MFFAFDIIYINQYDGLMAIKPPPMKSAIVVKALETAITSNELKIDITDKDSLRKLAIKTLVSVIQANPTSLAVVPALKELFDRVDGKAPQQITLDGEIRKVTVNCNIRFTDELPLGVDNRIIEHVDKPQVIDNKQ